CQKQSPLPPCLFFNSRLPAAARSVAACFHGTAAQNRQSEIDGREQSRASRSGGAERISSAIIWRARFGAPSESRSLSTAEDRKAGLTINGGILRRNQSARRSGRAWR